jgi:hypothetical protein
MTELDSESEESWIQSLGMGWGKIEISEAKPTVSVYMLILREEKPSTPCAVSNARHHCCSIYVRVSDKVMQYARTQKPAMKVYTKTVP